MTTDEKIRDEKLHYEINSEAAKISAFSYGKIGRYGYLMGEEILPLDQKKSNRSYFYLLKLKL